MNTMNSVLLNLCLFLCLLIVGYGCATPLWAEGPSSESNTTAHQSSLKKLTPTQEKTRVTLSTMFTSEKRVDKDFKTLRKILSSEVYTRFLKTEYPGDFKDFESFVVSPDAEAVKIRQLCQKYIPKVSNQDIEKANADYWKMRDVAVQQANMPTEKRYEAMMQVLFKPKPNPHSESDMWWINRFGFDFFTLNTFATALLEMAERDQTIENHFIHDIIKRYGTDDGMLRLAVMNPKSVGHILKRFKSLNALAEWLTLVDNRKEKQQ